MILGRSWCYRELKIASSVVGLHNLNEIVTLYVPIMRDVTRLASHDAIFVPLWQLKDAWSRCVRCVLGETCEQRNDHRERPNP